MMNPFVDDKAPYALALLVTLLGWFLTNAVADAEKSMLLTYDLAAFESGGKDYLRLTLRNQSLSLQMRDIPVVLECGTREACLTKANPMTRNAFFVINRVNEWRVKVNPPASSAEQTTNVVIFTPTIPARSELEVVFGRVTGTVSPTVSFELPSSVERTPQLERGFSVRGALFQNWFWVLLIGGLLLALTVLGWIAATTKR